MEEFCIKMSKNDKKRMYLHYFKSQIHKFTRGNDAFQHPGENRRVRAETGEHEH